MDDDDDDNGHQQNALIHQIRDYVHSRMIDTGGAVIPVGLLRFQYSIDDDFFDVFLCDCRLCPRPLCCIIQAWHREKDGWMSKGFHEHVSPHLPDVTNALERMCREDDRWLPHLKPDEYAPLPAP